MTALPGRSACPRRWGSRAGTPPPSSASSRRAGVRELEHAVDPRARTMRRDESDLSTPMRAPARSAVVPDRVHPRACARPAVDVHDHPHRLLPRPVQERVRRRPRLHRADEALDVLGRLRPVDQPELLLDLRGLRHERRVLLHALDRPAGLVLPHRLDRQLRAERREPRFERAGRVVGEDVDALPEGSCRRSRGPASP